MEPGKARIRFIRLILPVTVALTVCGVILWGQNARSIPMDLPAPKESYVRCESVCNHGHCINGECVCNKAYTGPYCDQRRDSPAVAKEGDSSSCTQTGKLKDVEQHLIINIPTVGADLEEKEVWEDLIRCSDMYTEYNNISHHYEIIMKRLHLMQEYIPAKFSAHFRNPCWYNFHQRPTGPLIYNKDCMVPHQNNQSLAENILRQARTSSERHLYCLPSFFVPGFPKCATSTLFKTIIQHPLVAASRCKEGKFWKRFFVQRGTDLDIRIRPLWYLNMLFHAVPYIESNPLSITLDASSTYAHSYHEDFCLVPTLLKRVLPEAKFILIMRNPSKRYFSHYWFKSALLSFESKSELSQYAHSTKGLKDFHDRTVQAIEWFRTCVDHGSSVMSCVLLIDQPVNVSHFLHHSLYYYHIVPWLKIFPRERFLFLRTEDLANDLSSTMSKVWQFLNLNDVPSERVLKNVDRVIQDLPLPQETKVLLDEFYRPHNQLLANLLSDTRYLWND